VNIFFGVEMNKFNGILEKIADENKKLRVGFMLDHRPDKMIEGEILALESKLLLKKKRTISEKSGDLIGLDPGEPIRRKIKRLERELHGQQSKRREIRGREFNLSLFFSHRDSEQAMLSGIPRLGIEPLIVRNPGVENSEKFKNIFKGFLYPKFENWPRYRFPGGEKMQSAPFSVFKPARK